MEFPLTPHSLFANAALQQEALEYFCQHYRRPVLNFLQSRGILTDRCEDIAHDFLLQFISSNALRRSDRNKGRFRTYLLCSLRNFIASQAIHDHAQIRGGGVEKLSLDHGNLADAIADQNDPEVLEHDRQWAVNLYLASFRRLEAEAAIKGKTTRFDAFRPFLLPRGEAPSMATVGEQLGIAETAVRAELLRLRQRFVTIFREEVAITVASPDEIDEEVAHLQHVIRSPGVVLENNLDKVSHSGK